MELLEQPWVRKLFEKFCQSSLLDHSLGSMTKRLDRYSTFFTEIDRRRWQPSNINQESLFEAFGAEGLRRHFVVVSFVAAEFGVPWSDQALEDLTEKRRIDSKLSACRTQPWFFIVDGYINRLYKQQSLKTRTIRLYLNTAVQFLTHSKTTSVQDIQDAQVTAFLKKFPGHLASLQPFFNFLSLCKPGINPKQNRTEEETRRTEKRLVRMIRRSVKDMESAAKTGKYRALLAELLSKLYGVPLNRVLRLCLQDIQPGEFGFVLWPESLAIDVHELLHPHIERLISEANTPLLFAGRNGLQSLSTGAVRHHLQRLA